MLQTNEDAIFHRVVTLLWNYFMILAPVIFLFKATLFENSCICIKRHILSSVFLNGPFPASFSLLLSFQYTVDRKQMFNINNFFADDCIWTAKPLVSEATALPTEPHNHCPFLSSVWINNLLAAIFSHLANLLINLRIFNNY